MITNIMHESEQKIVVGIDATNIRLGGGITHLLELLKHFNPNTSPVNRVVLWGNKDVLDEFPNFFWLKKISPRSLSGSFVRRVFWQLFSLTRQVRKEQCDVLFIPGGSYIGGYEPVVTMCQNLLPFEAVEIRRFWPKLVFFKLILLRIIQTATLKNSDGVIFLSHYSKNKIISSTGKMRGLTAIIPHGLNRSFMNKPRVPKNIREYSLNKPFKLLYVSNIDVYKHQVPVLNAVKNLVRKGYPLKVLFVGPGSKKSVNKFAQLLKTVDRDKVWCEFLGLVKYGNMQNIYNSVDLAIFASSCETFGITLLEKMASGLPITCSDMSSMPEILQDGGIYFSPENPDSIAEAIEQYLLSPILRFEKQKISYSLAQNFSWEECSQKTFSFLQSVALGYKK